MADHNFRSSQRRNPIAEIAQLIGHADPYGQSAPADNGLRRETASDGYDEPPRVPQPYCADDQPRAADEEYRYHVPRMRRRNRLALGAAIFAVVGVAGAFGYRGIFADSAPRIPLTIIEAGNDPNKIAPATSEPQATNNSSQADIAVTGSIATAVPSMRADQSAAADIAAEPNRAHSAAVPIEPANARPPAAVTPPVLGGGYAVQVTSERSESRAETGFRVLQAKYPNQLGGRQPIIRRVDLGATGTYYRALVGPFASAQKAATFCSELKAAGGNCIIQKN